ncbi:vWA domain-containing protein [Tunicatimonas pelagia]|uniref:vWA domain-containing protein n=1 Tax=Tunicatimonas pelagia TaxID=931531 RepID=UPI0026655639|nr:VWA domain-containing protein [Tunicatimonas pelagia]WKN45367.1 VWA domain-containing protein [Tunicatimonas pelagia]
MDWYRSFSTTEIIFLTLFIIGYILYLTRVIRINRVIPVGYQAVVFKVGLRILYFVLFLVALLGPLMGKATKEIQAVGKDIFILVDLSQSMNANDVQPSRLEKVKYELKDIVKSFSSDRIGLIIFSSEAFIQSPLTYDQGALNMFIDALNTSLVPNSGTDFTPPLRLALEKFEKDEENPSQQKSKVLLLISDGEDFGDNISAVSEKIQQSGIRLFTLGVGTEQGSQLVVRGVPKTDRSGNVVISKLKPQALQQLANQTSGQYFEISGRQDDTERLISSIGQIEGELRDSRQIDASANKYFYFLLLGVGLFLIDHLVKLKTVRI